MQLDLRYQHVETALIGLHEVGNKKIAAFRARIRHLRNLGVPNLPKVGSGIQITYTMDHVNQLFLALELLAFGINPSIVAKLIAGPRWEHLGRDIAKARNHKPELYLVCQPELMGAWNFDEEVRPIVITGAFFATSFKKGRLWNENTSRVAVFNLTRRIYKLDFEINKAVSARG
jgi:hypothetical protein